MHKILLAILLFVIFFFPNSEVFAIADKPCGPRTDVEINGVKIKTPPWNDCPSDSVCYKVVSPEYECYKLKGAAAGAPAGGAPAAPAAAGAGGGATTNTSGGGQRCTPGATTVTTAGTGIMTAIGCVPTEPKALVEGLLKYGTVAAGAIAFLLMLLGALGLITAEGNPETIKASQERFYSAIIGLLFIIFAVLLMQVIGVDILGLPGFGR